jgi:hypothetical protein
MDNLGRVLEIFLLCDTLIVFFICIFRLFLVFRHTRLWLGLFIFVDRFFCIRFDFGFGYIFFCGFRRFDGQEVKAMSPVLLAFGLSIIPVTSYVSEIEPFSLKTFLDHCNGHAPLTRKLSNS